MSFFTGYNNFIPKLDAPPNIYMAIIVLNKNYSGIDIGRHRSNSI
jgi:hypothetical protein